MRAITVVVLLMACVAIGTHAMTDEEAEGILSGRIREWPIPPAGRESATNTTDAEAEAEEEYQVRIGSGLGATASCGCGESATISNEGSRACCYFDSVGIPTIGVGHNLRSNPSAISKYGLNPTTVINTCGKYTSYKSGYCLTSAQITDLFSTDFAPSKACAKSVAPNAPACVSAALADMAFNLGCPGLKGFSNTLRYINNKNWAAAASEAGNSLWCSQVGSRCARDQACIRSGN